MHSRPAGELTPVLLYRQVVAGEPESPWQVSTRTLAADLDAVMRSGRAVLTASALDDELAGPHRRPGGLCALTFDDGRATFLDLVLPMLVERGLPATVYVTTGTLGQPGMLSGASLVDLLGTGVEIGAHTVIYRDLDLLPDAVIRCELAVSRDHLAELLGVAPRSFAYPYGSFHRTAHDLVSYAGYDNAYAVKNALTHRQDDPYARARVTVLAGTGRRTVEGWLGGRGAPPSWQGERLRTKLFRHVRATLAQHR
jgi:peptidoglycan/xylan/chitin deacetylase (PgdA/CDA1 family)